MCNKKHLILWLGGCTLCALTTGEGAQPSPLAEVSESPPAAIESPLDRPRIEIHKARRELLLYDGDQLVRQVPIGLGFAPEGHKILQGDGKTPEGEYRVIVKNPKSSYYLSLGLDYPNAEDAARGLREGRISQRQHDAIVRAHRRGVRPPWDTPLGGEIYLHGRGASSDWTLGCVALDDPAMKELFIAVRVGTMVRILL